MEFEFEIEKSPFLKKKKKKTNRRNIAIFYIEKNSITKIMSQNARSVLSDRY